MIILSAAFGFFVAIASKLALFDIFFALSPSTTLFPQANILVLGVDSAFGHRSDTIMLLHTDPEKKQASLLSIPRDTLAVLPGRGLDKINHAYAYGGAPLARQTVEYLLNIKVPYYIVADLSGLVKIIDELGGIPINIKKRMYYVDYAGGLQINLKPGGQKLSGKDAMGYLRYRVDGGDFSRINRQQKFLNAFASEVTKRQNLMRSPKIFLSLLSHLDTNLSAKQTLALCLGLRSAHELGQVSMHTVPGTDIMVDGIYYWRPDMKVLKNLAKDFSRTKNDDLLRAKK